MADADWIEALSPEAKNIVGIVENSIEESGHMPINPDTVQLRQFYISYLAQDVPCEAEVNVRIVAGRYLQWGTGYHFDTSLSVEEAKVLLPMEIAEMAVSNMHPGEVMEVRRVVVSPLPEWARGVIGADSPYPRFGPESIIEVMDYYEISDRPSYYYPEPLLRESLKMCDAWRVLDIYNEHQDNETISTWSEYVLESCFKKSSINDLFYYQQHYKEDCPEIASQALRALQHKCYREEDLKCIVSTLLGLILKDEVFFYEKDRKALR